MAKRYYLTYDQAVAMLPAGDYVHTLVSGPTTLVGTDWERQDVLQLLRTGRPELAGDGATAMGHGICVWRTITPEGYADPVFIKTKEASDGR